MAGTSRASASSDWMLHPSLVFKTFEDNLIKSPFSYANTPHIVPEKILESFVDQNGIRCYRVKWLDSWLTEQHVTAAFPHLITEYWINKPINDNVDYQNYIVQGRTLPNLQIPVTSSNVSAPKAVPPTTKTPENLSETLQQISQAPTSITISQLFGNEATKEVEIPGTDTDSNVVEDNDIESVAGGDTTDFNVSDGLQLPEKVGNSTKQEKEEVKEDEKFSAEEPHALPVPVDGDVPKISENSMVFLFDKNGGYTVTESNNPNNNPNEREKSPVNKVPHIAPFNHPFKAHLNNFVGPPTIRLPSMTLEHINNQHPQQISVQSEVTNAEKKVTVKRSPNKQVKPVSKEKIPVVCDICGKTISSRKNLRVHKTVKHFKNGSFACQICGRKFALNRDLKRHMPLHTNERKYQCAHCGLQCKQPGHLTKHIRTHTEVMNWRCDCCFKNFKVQADLKAHCFTEHANIHKENLTCSVCKEKLKLPNSVYLHSLRHSGVREFQCEICKASFKLKQHMQVHMKTHTKPKEIALITCPICQREFKFKHTYRKHFSKHLEKTKEEYDENARLRQEEKKRKLEEKRSPDIKFKKKRVKEDESQYSASDGEESKVLQKRKQRKPERVYFDRELNKTDILVREKMKKLTCIHCELTFATQALYKSHMKLHKLDNKFNKTITPRPIPVIEGKQIDSGNFSNDSQMVMLKLPVPVIETSESNNLDDANASEEQSNIELNNTISQQISNAIAMSTLTGFQEKESIPISTLSEDSEVNCRDMSIRIEDAVKGEINVLHQEKELITN